MHLKDVYVRQAKAQTQVNPAENAVPVNDGADALRLVQEAIKRAGLKQDYLARSFDINPGQLSSALNGNGHLALRWLWMWPDEFWAEFLPLVRAAKERTGASRRMLKVEKLKNAIADLLDVFEEAAS